MIRISEFARGSRRSETQGHAFDLRDEISGYNAGVTTVTRLKMRSRGVACRREEGKGERKRQVRSVCIWRACFFRSWRWWQVFDISEMGRIYLSGIFLGGNEVMISRACKLICYIPSAVYRHAVHTCPCICVHTCILGSAPRPRKPKKRLFNGTHNLSTMTIY